MQYRQIPSLLVCLLLTLSFPLASPSPVFAPIQPPSFPLAVRNPYLSTWIPGPLVADLPAQSPQFWNGNDLTWGIIARVDSTTYTLFGITEEIFGTTKASVLSASYTSTHSIFVLSAGTAKFQLDFFSPVSPSNYLRQSLPFSYLTISVSDTRGSSIQLYSDIDGTWTGQLNKTVVQFENLDNTSAFTLSVKDAFLYSQNADDQALWGDVVFASRESSGSILTVETGPSQTVRGQFMDHGALLEANASTNATINSNAFAFDFVVGLSHDLGNVASQEVSVTFEIGYVREDAINYLGRSYTGYYRATYPDTFSALSAFIDDYDDAQAESVKIDAKVSTAAQETAGSNYSDIVTLSLRQAFGGIDIVIPTDTLDTNAVFGFIKEISSDGNVNTIDVIMPAFPLYYAIEPEYIKLLLDPVLQYLETGLWTEPWVIHDIGSDYPNATGHNDQVAEQMPIEETGNLMVLSYAYVLASGNTAWAERYLPLLQHYADYLVFNSLNISNQLSTNDAAGPLPNETDLAVKAAVGLKAFGVLSGLQNYSDIGDDHANILWNLGLATNRVVDPTHLTLEYPNNKTTFKIQFNLYPDILLSLNNFPAATFAVESSFYPTVHDAGGIPLDNRQDWSKTDWLLWVAGFSSTSTRDLIINDIWRFISNGLNVFPFSDRYIVSSDQGSEVGTEFALKARPTVGGHFALLALNGPGSLKLSTDTVASNATGVSLARYTTGTPLASGSVRRSADWQNAWRWRS